MCNERNTVYATVKVHIFISRIATKSATIYVPFQVLNVATIDP